LKRPPSATEAAQEEVLKKKTLEALKKRTSEVMSGYGSRKRGGASGSADLGAPPKAKQKIGPPQARAAQPERPQTGLAKAVAGLTKAVTKAGAATGAGASDDEDWGAWRAAPAALGKSPPTGPLYVLCFCVCHEC
jgi:hypothetical protein